MDCGQEWSLVDSKRWNRGEGEALLFYPQITLMAQNF
jgi:hypothetical protein